MYGDVIDEIFAVGNFVRYVAFGGGQRVEARQRDGLQNASNADSDRYEELFVNPTLVTLGRQRGDLDCGGLRHIIVAYGSFTQVIIPTSRGHVSVALERSADAEGAAAAIGRVLQRANAAVTGSNHCP